MCPCGVKYQRMVRVWQGVWAMNINNPGPLLCCGIDFWQDLRNRPLSRGLLSLISYSQTDRVQKIRMFSKEITVHCIWQDVLN